MRELSTSIETVTWNWWKKSFARENTSYNCG